MLSSRKVYAPSTEPLSETAATGPGDLYGRHKLAVEQALRDLLGERLTVLRLANIFGYEHIPGRRTFLALCLDRLAREGRIHYGMSPFVARDFLPAEAFARVLARIAASPPGGILNVGSGIALPTGRLALWILEGFRPRRAGDRIDRGERSLRARHRQAARPLRRTLLVGRSARGLRRDRTPPGIRSRSIQPLSAKARAGRIEIILRRHQAQLVGTARAGCARPARTSRRPPARARCRQRPTRRKWPRNKAQKASPVPPR